jgi:hypothetical protein
VGRARDARSRRHARSGTSHPRLDGERLCFAVRAARAPTTTSVATRASAARPDEFPSYYEIRGAVAHGRAEAARRSRLGPDWSEWAIPLDDVASFDFRKVRNKY